MQLNNQQLKELIDVLNNDDLLNEWGTNNLLYAELYPYKACYFKLMQKVVDEFKKQTDDVKDRIKSKLTQNPDENISALLKDINLGDIYSPMGMLRLKAIDTYLDSRNTEAYNKLKIVFENNSEDLYLRSEYTYLNILFFIPEIFLATVVTTLAGLALLGLVVWFPSLIIALPVAGPLGLAVVAMAGIGFGLCMAALLLIVLYDKISNPICKAPIKDNNYSEEINRFEFKNGNKNYTAFFKEPRAFSGLRKIQPRNNNESYESNSVPSNVPTNDKGTLYPIANPFDENDYKKNLFPI